MADSGGLAEDAARLRISQGDGLPTDARPVASAPPLEPAVLGNKRVWDITANFRSAASTLPSGHLIKDENFTLFESVAALEIMDAKMDSGLLQPGEQLYDSYDVLQDLSPEQVIGIVDQLFQYEMAWHSGYPLSQSLFSCHYIDALLWPEPKSLDDCQFFRGRGPDASKTPILAVLRAICLGLIKCCSLVNQIVLESHYFEEEDFSTHTFNRDLLTRVQEQPILELLDEAISVTRATTEWSTDARSGLIDRLSFRRDLLSALRDCIEGEDRPPWSAVRDLVSAMNDSHEIGRAVPEAFSRKIQRKLMSTVPPRPIIELSWERSVEQMQQLCDECGAAFSIFSTATEGPEATTTFLLCFSARRPEPLPFSRSYTSNALLERFQETFAQILRRDLELFVLPASEVLDASNWTVERPLTPGTPNPKFEFAQIIDDFASRAIPDFGGYIDYWKALCSNRCRLRRQLCHVLLRLDELQRDGEDLDARLLAVRDSADGEQSDGPLTRYAYHFKLRVMEWIIQLGFELDVYLPDEYAGLYWLLSSVCRRREEQLWQILENNERQGVSGDRAGRQDHDALERSRGFVRSQIELAAGNAKLAEALYTLYTYLHYLQLLPGPVVGQPKSTARLRYELRMKPFLTLSDGFLDMFDDYVAVTHPFGDYDQGIPSVAGRARPVCDVADRVAKDARSNYSALKGLGAGKALAGVVEREWTAEVSNLIKSTVAVGLAASTIQKAAAGGKLADLKLEVPKSGGRYHDYWVVPKLAAG